MLGISKSTYANQLKRGGDKRLEFACKYIASNYYQLASELDGWYECISEETICYCNLDDGNKPESHYYDDWEELHVKIVSNNFFSDQILIVPIIIFIPI